MYIYLTDKSIDFQYKPKICIQYTYNNEIHYYNPDFIVEGHIIEIKGDHFFKEDGTMCNPYGHSQDALYEAKHQCMLANDVKILTSNDYKKYIDYVNTTYGKNFLKSLRCS